MTTPTTSPTNKKLQLIEQARNVLRGQWATSEELKNLYKELEAWDQFAYATDVLLAKIKQDQADGKPDSLSDHQELAKFIYKDHSLPSTFKFDRALQELNTFDDLSQTEKCETLGLAGAIYKYKWLYNHQHENLELSLHYYGRGFESWRKYLAKPFDERAASEGDLSKPQNPMNDFGYTAINYAYVMELLAVDKLELMPKDIDPVQVESQIEKAKEVRRFILNQFVESAKSSLNRSGYRSRVYATVAEAFFGLQNFNDALAFIKLFKESKLSSIGQADDKALAWKTRTLSRQLQSLAYLQQIYTKWSLDHHGDSPEAKLRRDREEKERTQCLQALLSSGAASAVTIKKEGKVGLALSGGGFRASLFHIGVLAALAERDKLKDVEVISCVSGGSIIGAFYYLELKKQLEEKSDVDYVAIVKSVETKFLEGVQKNLRMRVVSNLWCNLRMIFDQNYSRTNRLGELYEKHLYNQFSKTQGPLHMRDLLIKPHDNPTFDIGIDNASRANKIPQLILNATAVNTGHNWQFTATWMGEPPGSIESDIDSKPRLRRMYYGDAPKKYQDFRLGYAVGASSCVPVLFTPLPLFNLYPDDPQKKKIELQLVDGGLHDNQGIASLLEQECSSMIISDASGQMSTTSEAEETALSVFFRADTILQERIRELQFRDIKARASTAQIASLIKLHLKSDLQEKPVSWLTCTDPPRSIYNDNFKDDPNELTDYGVLRSTQQLLSEIRTDLDSFSDTEAWALMYSGYVQTHYQFERHDKGGQEPKPIVKRSDWKFLQIKDHVTVPGKAKEIEKVLTTAKKVPFKLIDLNLPLKIFSFGLLLAAGITFLYYGILYWKETIYFPIRVNAMVYALIVVFVGMFSKVLASVLNYKTRIRKKVLLIVVALFAWISSNIYLILFNGLYNRSGKLKLK